MPDVGDALCQRALCQTGRHAELPGSQTPAAVETCAHSALRAQVYREPRAESVARQVAHDLVARRVPFRCTAHEYRPDGQRPPPANSMPVPPYIQYITLPGSSCRLPYYYIAIIIRYTGVNSSTHISCCDDCYEFQQQRSWVDARRLLKSHRPSAQSKNTRSMRRHVSPSSSQIKPCLVENFCVAQSVAEEIAHMLMNKPAL